MSYQQAERAYIQGNYSEAASLIDGLAKVSPEDPRVRLLRGHIYCYGLQRYDTALADYESIPRLTDEQSFLDYASQGIATCREFGGLGEATPEDDMALNEPFDLGEMDGREMGNGGMAKGYADDEEPSAWSSGLGNSASLDHFGPDAFVADPLDFDSVDGGGNTFGRNASAQDEPSFGQMGRLTTQERPSTGAGSRRSDSNLELSGGLNFDDVHFDESASLTSSPSPPSLDLDDFGDRHHLDDLEDPFASPQVQESAFPLEYSDDFSADPFGEAMDFGQASPSPSPDSLGFEPSGFEMPDFGLSDMDAPFGSPETHRSDATLLVEEDGLDSGGLSSGDMFSSSGNDTLKVYSSEGLERLTHSRSAAGASPFAAEPLNNDDSFGLVDPAFGLDDLAGPEVDAGGPDSLGFGALDPGAMDSLAGLDDLNYAADFAPSSLGTNPGQSNPGRSADFSNGEDSGFDTFSHKNSRASASPAAFMIGEDPTEGSTGSQASNVDFLEEFDAFDNFGSLADLDVADDSVGFTVPMPSSGFDIPTGSSGAPPSSEDLSNFDMSVEEMGTVESVWSTDSMPSFAQAEVAEIEPTVAVEQGLMAPLENASLGTKRFVIAGIAGLTAAAGAAGLGFYMNQSAPNATEETVQSHLNRSLIVTSLAGGAGGLLGAAVVGEIVRRQIRRTTEDLQAQFSKISQGNFNAQATIYSRDELGELSAGFNQMARVILATTKEAQRKAEEQEQQKEDLQRQVIRLLDDVEGAARGDLTVQAEVTADVLGAVADSFNLTIQNLREIVAQVKVAALQVSKGSSENETFARSLSSDALRQAEELAVTLNSVQVMTDSIQRVAENAREAEEVARTASVTALKGGEAVEKTVTGILRVRETVAETTRKVKRLAESAQEISKIVALISNIASRTNLLALNASIEAARAGDAGRGFAIVADEVRQLADRAAKSSKEIEQIVLQIQGETSSVMTAMEEGTQQVIEGTKLAEQAKRSLDDIIQVSTRIDQLVRSITADTVEQTETSRQVAQVMQSVELTAQETSQEAQRVSRSLQNLVNVARDLQTSVERFRVETSGPLT